MATTYPDISLPINLGRFRIPKAEGDLAYQDGDGLHLFTGGDAGYALGSTTLSRSALSASINQIQQIVPQTITLASVTLHLVAGMTVNLNYNFASADPNFNDFAFAVLADSKNKLSSALLYDEKYFVRDYNATGSDVAKLYALLQGSHSGQHFTVDHTDDYTLVVGIADVGDKTGSSALLVNDVSIGLPGTMYTASIGAVGLQLTDGTIFNAFGYEIPAGGTLAQAVTQPPVLSAGGQGLVTAFYAQALNEAIRGVVLGTASASGGGLLNTAAGGAVNLLAGGLPSLTTTTAVAGSGLVAVNGAGLISQDGGGLIGQDGGGLISQDGGGLISQDGGGLISQDGGGLISQDGGGLISQDGGGLISQDGGGLAASGATATFVPRGSGLRAFAAVSSSASTDRNYTLTGLPSATPAAPPVANGDVVVSPAAIGFSQNVTPAVAALSNGNTIAVWADNDSGSEYRVRGQLYDGSGAKSGGILDISTTDGFGQTNPSATALAGGGFVVSWTDRHTETAAGSERPTIATDVRARFFAADGTPAGSAVTVDTITGANQDQSSAASLTGGGAVVVFHSDTQSGGVAISAQSLLVQRYAADGTRLGGNVAFGGSAGAAPAAAGLPDGGFVAAYADAKSAGVGHPAGIYIQRFAADGSIAGDPVLVNTTSTGSHIEPAVAALTDGTFVVTWHDVAFSGAAAGDTVRAQRFTAAGLAVGREILVAGPAELYAMGHPAITALRGGGFAVTWPENRPSTDPSASGGSTDLYAQVYAADGTALGDSFAVNARSPGVSMTNPAATTLPDGRLLILGSRSNGDSADIRAESFSFPTTPGAAMAYGRVVDGFVQGATVFADANGNGVRDAGEATATTDQYGRFTFGAAVPAGTIIATGGTDVGTGLPFTMTFTAPAGSLAVTALSTIAQKMMDANPSMSLGEANARIALAFGLPLQTDTSTLNPVHATLDGRTGAAAALVANAVVQDTLALAQAYGARGDVFAGLASQVAGADYGTVDATSLSTLQSLGLGFSGAYVVSSLASSFATLLGNHLATDTDRRTLVYNVTATDRVVQGAEASALKRSMSDGSLGAVFNRYTGSNLAAQVDAESATSAGHPFNFNYTDTDTSMIGNAQGEAYTGPVSYLRQQFLWSSNDAVAMSAATPSVFLRGGGGQDALVASGGSNVLDGRGGSNFLVGADGSDGGADTFFLDGTEGGTTWSTLVNFHFGDNATIFGFHPGVSTMDFLPLAGADGYQGLTLRSELNGAGTGINASFTFAGITQAVADAHFTTTSGTINPGSAKPIDYLLIQYDH